MKGRRAQNRNFLGVLFFATMLCLLSGWLYSRNSLFRLSEVEISGANSDLKKEVQEKVLEYFGNGLFSISLSEVENKILILPEIDKVSFHRRWPSKLMIEVTEKIPIGLTEFKGNLWWIDKKGELVQLAQKEMNLPKITGFHSKEDGNFLLTDERAHEFFTWLAAQAARKNLGAGFLKISEINWNQNFGASVKTTQPEMIIDIGFEQFDLAWTRAEIAAVYFKSKNLSVEKLDTTYSKRVVAQIKEQIKTQKSESKLQNSQNILNLRELVRRTEQPQNNEPAAAR